MPGREVAAYTFQSLRELRLVEGQDTTDEALDAVGFPGAEVADQDARGIRAQDDVGAMNHDSGKLEGVSRSVPATWTRHAGWRICSGP